MYMYPCTSMSGDGLKNGPSLHEVIEDYVDASDPIDNQEQDYWELTGNANIQYATCMHTLIGGYCQNHPSYYASESWNHKAFS